MHSQEQKLINIITSFREVWLKRKCAGSFVEKETQRHSCDDNDEHYHRERDTEKKDEQEARTK